MFFFLFIATFYITVIDSSVPISLSLDRRTIWPTLLWAECIIVMTTCDELETTTGLYSQVVPGFRAQADVMLYAKSSQDSARYPDKNSAVTWEIRKHTYPEVIHRLLSVGRTLNTCQQLHFTSHLYSLKLVVVAFQSLLHHQAPLTKNPHW